MAQNVLGTELVPCSLDPLTGFYRNGCCDTGGEDMGVHVVCVRATEEFLAFSKAAGNDLSTPRPEFGFVGLQPDDLANQSEHRCVRRDWISRGRGREQLPVDCAQ